MHGKGVFTWKDGRKYEGEYQDDKKYFIVIKLLDTDLVNLHGLMGEFIKGIGKMENSMGKEFTLGQVVKKKKANGMKAKG